MKPIALITGATSGIGEATARLLASSHFLILCGRRIDRLESLARELKVFTDIHTLSFDVRDQEHVKSSIEGLPEQWRAIDVLINSAGNAHGLSFIQDGDSADWDAMIDINVKGLLYVSQSVIPLMTARNSGHIVNIGSIAGIEVYPKGNVYNASKYAVNAISQGMRMDLNPYGIKVTEIKPGLVDTEFSLIRFKGDEDKAEQVYKGFDPLLAKDVADTIKYAITRPAHVVIADMVVLPTAQASATIVKKDL
ncbi:MAG: 3-hydroxy acid dehydrogenase/malonic semialdehyde reductase [Cyclobacteriaceae bacterium]|jgi:3-hydroxy acid dehydrogenase/malonic semialdehyde reductase